MKRFFVFTLVLALVISIPTTATIINVPGDYSTIQAGINASTEGDTVLVQPGTYVENIVWTAVNGIKLFSAGDSSNTIINGSQSGSVIRFGGNGNFDSTTVLRGFRITNGDGYPSGGGINMYQSSPIIEECMVSGNKAFGGGGISCTYGRPIIRSCTIYQNEGTTLAGGIFCSQSGLIIDSCIIIENQGGGIHFAGGHPTIKNSTVSGNFTIFWGCGISCHETNLTIENCTVIENQGVIGGGIVCSSSALTMRGVLVEGNTSRYFGGGITCHNSSPSIEHCTIVGNTGDEGDGIYVTDHSLPIISYSNIYQNGMGVYNDDTTQVLNCPNNWWGDVSGPYHPTLNPGGLGDSVNADVNPLPFLTEPDTIAPPTAVPNQDLVVPEGFTLSQNYPNPFNTATVLMYSIPQPGRTTLTIWNILGRKVVTLYRGMQVAGTHKLTWNATEVSSGIYFAHLQSGNHTKTIKMVLLK